MDALEEEASDILIDPTDDSTYSVRMRVDAHGPATGRSRQGNEIGGQNRAATSPRRP